MSARDTFIGGGKLIRYQKNCTEYEAGARGKGVPDSGTNHVGFLCVMAKEKWETVRARVSSSH
jgi:hypothetical protein